jgi:hypothetical protein
MQVSHSQGAPTLKVRGSHADIRQQTEIRVGTGQVQGMMMERRR